jgi:hypothetical protein
MIAVSVLSFSRKLLILEDLNEPYTKRKKKIVQKERPVAATMLLFQGILIQGY